MRVRIGGACSGRGPHQPSGDIRLIPGAQGILQPGVLLHGVPVFGGHLRRGHSERVSAGDLSDSGRRGEFRRPWVHQGRGLGAEIVGTFVLVYVVFAATDAKRKARDSHVPVPIHHPILPPLLKNLTK